jgi:hypothetical protein
LKFWAATWWDWKEAVRGTTLDPWLIEGILASCSNNAKFI